MLKVNKTKHSWNGVKNSQGQLAQDARSRTRAFECARERKEAGDRIRGQAIDLSSAPALFLDETCPRLSNVM
jgi:hypothetical protein